MFVPPTDLVKFNYDLSYKRLSFSYSAEMPWNQGFDLSKSSYKLNYNIDWGTSKIALGMLDTVKDGYRLNLSLASTSRFGHFNIDYLQLGDRKTLNLSLSQKFE